jgi:hypothetical protein
MVKSLVLTLCLLIHPVHVSLTSIDYVPEKDSLKVFVKFYFDDFLLDLGLNGEDYTKGDFPSDSVKVKGIIEGYVNSKLSIGVNEKAIRGKLNKLEIVDNEVKLDLLYRTAKKPEKMVVRNEILTQIYSDQANFMIVRINDFEEGVRLTSDMTVKEFNISDQR